MSRRFFQRRPRFCAQAPPNSQKKVLARDRICYNAVDVCVVFALPPPYQRKKDRQMKNVVIIGAGPAGLTAALELLRTPEAYRVIVLEESDQIGGISRTVCHNGNRMDIGGHRFFPRMSASMRGGQTSFPCKGSRQRTTSSPAGRFRWRVAAPIPSARMR